MRLRSFIPAPLQSLGIASIFVVGVAFATQNQERDENGAQPKPAAKTDAKTDVDASQPAPSKTAPRTGRAQDPAAVNRTQPRTGQGEQPSEQQRAALGAQLEAQGDQGLRVTTVEPNGLWARAGLRQNDHIISIEGRAIANSRQLEAWLWSQPGRQIPVIIDRGGQRYTIQLVMPQHGDNMGWVGVNLDEGDADERGEAETKGARVTQIYPNGPASRAGLLPGDVITRIDNEAVEGAADAVLQIRELQPQSRAMFVAMRDGEEVNLEVMIGSRATSGYQSSYGQQPNFPQGQQGQFNDPRFAGNQQFQGQGGNNMWQGVPPYAMQLEHQRRMAEQNERIETELAQLREEVKKLRELLEKK